NNVPSKIISQGIFISSHAPGVFLYFLSPAVVAQRQPVQPGGIILRANSLDSPTPHHPKLSRYILSQSSRLIRPTHLCNSFIEFHQNRLGSHDHLPFHWKPGGLRTGANP